MKIFDLLKIVSACFNGLRIPYLVTGSIASMAYGEARFTNDIDVVAEIKNEHIPGILKCFPGDEYYLSEDSMKDAIFRRFQFNIIHPASGLKVDVIIKQRSEFDVSRFSRTNNFKMDDIGVNFAAPEDVIIKKMEFYKMGGSDKHLRDITGILKTSEDLIDLKYIEGWVGKLFLEDVWRTIQDR
jgi:hypothetical protein